MTPLIESFGIAVRQSREAERSDLNRSYVGEIERGKAIASLHTIEKLSGALGVNPSALLTRCEAISQANLVRRIRLTAIAC